MTILTHRRACKYVAYLLQLGLLCPHLYLFSQAPDYTFHSETEIVLVNVTARDRAGNLVRNLQAGDFKLSEDGKPQAVVSFDIENTDAVPALDVAQASPLANLPTAGAAPVENAKAAASLQYKDRRLIVLFFDLSAMEPDEIDHASTAAENYVDKQMAPADLVSVVSLGSSLQLNQDFTSDKAQLKKILQSFNSGSGQGFEEGSTGTTEGTPDTGGSFTVDDTEYNVFNTDRRLEALRSVSEQLAHIDQKKSLIYFSSGMDRTGIENQSELRSAANAAVRANLSIYTLDLRGLQALVSGGEAQNASLRGTSPYSGQSSLNALNSNFTTQETLVTLAGDTGGRAYLDSNDFSKVFKGVQDDTSTYYVLGYHSTNPARDGHYRRITVSVDRPGVKIEYRRGYYAPADYKHANKDDRERQLEQQLSSDLPATDLPLYLASGYFRIGNDRFFVPVSLVVPGSEIPFVSNSSQDKATLDVIGIVRDSNQRPVGNMRDTVKLAVNTSTLVKQKNVQYDSGFVLPAGKYHFKFVVRENQTGRTGSFETDFTVPELKNQPLKMSSVVLANQIQPAGKKKNADNPLVRDGSEIVPSVTHVFSTGQHLYLYYEVYDPGRDSGGNSKAGIRVLTNVAFFQGKVKVYETPLVASQELSAGNRKAAVFQLDVALTQLKPGFYTCQVNVIDDAAGHFLFPRLALLLRAETAPANPGPPPAEVKR